MRFMSGFLATCMLFIYSSTAHAIVMGGQVTGGNSGGVFEFLGTPPAEVGEDNEQSPNLFAFNEDQNILINAPLTVDVGTDPQANDVVASHYVYFDPTGTGLTTIEGYVDFDAAIFGIITSTVNLANSDFLINNAVQYNSPNLRGLESTDSVSIDTNNPNRLLIDWGAGTPGDYVRVLTMRSPGADMQVPEPQTLGLFALGLLGLFRVRQRRACK